MYLIDTNVHATYVLQKFELDEVSLKYVDAFEKILLSKRVVTDFVISELDSILLRVAPTKYGLNEGDRLVLKRLAFGYIHACVEHCFVQTPSLSVVRQSLDYYQRYSTDGYISFVDAMLLSMAKNNGYILMTMDERLQKKALAEGIEVFDL